MSMFVTKILKRGEKICVQKQFEYLQKQKLPAMEIYVLQLSVSNGSTQQTMTAETNILSAAAAFAE